MIKTLGGGSAFPDELLISMELCHIDLNRFYGSSVLEKLTDILRSLMLRKTELKAYYQVLYQKTIFLIEKQNRTPATSGVEYWYTGIKFVENGNTDDDYFHDYRRLHNTYYIYRNETQLLSGFVKELNDSLREKSVLDYYMLTKFYKSIDKRPKGIEQLIEELSHDASLDNNIEIKKLLKNHLYNSLFSSLLKNCLQSQDKSHYFLIEQDVADTYSQIVELQHDVKIKDYFPHLKYVRHALKKLETNVKLVQLKDEDTARELASSIQLVYERLKEAFEWSRKHRFSAIYFPHNQHEISPKRVKYENLNLILASSFVKPIDYDAIGDEIREIGNKIVDVSFKLDSALIICQLSEKVENTRDELNHKLIQYEESFKDESKKYLRGQIELLSIFAAVMLFSLGSIQIFKDIGTLDQALLFLSTFGLSLVSFGLVIRLVVFGEPAPVIKEEKRGKRFCAWVTRNAVLITFFVLTVINIGILYATYNSKLTDLIEIIYVLQPFSGRFWFF